MSVLYTSSKCQNQNNQWILILASHQKKKQKWAQTSKESYTKQYLVIKRSDRDDSYYAFCEPCGSYFSIAASGIYNIGVHVNYSSLGDLSRHLTITGWGEGGSLKAIYRREKMFFFFC